MKILILSPYPQEIASAIESTGDTWAAFSEPINPRFEVDYAISYGYRHIIKEPLLYSFPIINLHISLLPFNRGADPNFWSWFDQTPKGLTIHQVDSGIDTGPILAQGPVTFYDHPYTLASSYALLRRLMPEFFNNMWPSIRNGDLKPVPQNSLGTYHRSSDKDPYWARMPLGWETPVQTVIDFGKEARDGSH